MRRTTQHAGRVDPQFRSGIERAFRKLPLLADREFDLAVEIDQSALFAGSDVPVPAAFRSAGRKATERELAKLAKLASALSKQLAAIHGPAIDALADNGFLREDLTSRIDRLASAAERADLTGIPEREVTGRQPNLRAQGIALMLAYGYLKLTGIDPTYGPSREADGTEADAPFVGFLREMFSLLGLSAKSARRSAEYAVGVMQSRGHAHKSPSKP